MWKNKTARYRRIFWLCGITALLCCAGGEAGEKGRDIGVCVGINKYSRMAPLRYSANDAATMQRRLEGSGNFRRVYLLADTQDDPKFLPTAGNILATLRLAARAAREDDSLYFFFSGHGVVRDGESCLVPIDGDEKECIPIQEVRDIIEESRAGNKVMFIDACRSGGGAKGIGGVRGGLAKGSDDAMSVLVSCGEDQFSYEDEKSGLSLFTLFLSQALAGKADENGDGVLRGAEIYEYLDREMTDYCVEHDIMTSQTPQLNAAGREAAILRIDPEVMERLIEEEKREAQRLALQQKAAAEEEAIAGLMRQVSRGEEEGIQGLDALGESGNPNADYLLGKLYLLGQNVPKDLDKTRKYWDRALANQSLANPLRIDVVSEFRRPGYSSMEEKIERDVRFLAGTVIADYVCAWNEKGETMQMEPVMNAAKHGLTQAVVDLYCMFYLDMNSDDKKWVREQMQAAAEQGYEPAARYLASTTPNHGLLRYERETDMGDIIAPYRLGYAYSTGSDMAIGQLGITVDTEKAIHWYTKAVEMGNHDATSPLRVLVPAGNGNEY